MDERSRTDAWILAGGAAALAGLLALLVGLQWRIEGHMAESRKSEDRIEGIKRDLKLVREAVTRLEHAANR